MGGLPVPISNNGPDHGEVNHMSGPRIMIDGVPVPDGEAARVLLDDGLVRGDGVFEGMRQYGRRIRTTAAHLDRMERSCRAIALPFDRPLVAEELDRFSGVTAEADCAIRLMLTRGGQRILREEPLPPHADSWRLMPVEHRISPLLMESKTLSYAANMQANRLAKAAGFDEALMVRAGDRVVLEAPTSSFLWIEGGDVVFPPLSLGILDSLTRRLVVEAVPVRERELPVEGLEGADGALLVSTVLESRPIRAVGDIAIPTDGARLAEVRRALSEITLARLG